MTGGARHDRHQPPLFVNGGVAWGYIRPSRICGYPPFGGGEPRSTTETPQMSTLSTATGHGPRGDRAEEVSSLGLSESVIDSEPSECGRSLTTVTWFLHPAVIEHVGDADHRYGG